LFVYYLKNNSECLWCYRSVSPANDQSSILERGSLEDQHYVNSDYPTSTTSGTTSSASQSPFDASVWNRYHYYQSQFYRQHQQYYGNAQYHSGRPNSVLHCSWQRAVVVSDVGLINEVNQHRARLVLGWVTVFGRVNHLGM